MNKSPRRSKPTPLLLLIVLLVSLSTAAYGNNNNKNSTNNNKINTTTSLAATDTCPETCPATETCDQITFSPDVTTVTAGDSDDSIDIEMTAFDCNGNEITPSTSNPLHVNVYGAPTGVITDTITSGSTFTFSYNGAAFPNNISVNAWITDQTAGAAIGQSAIGQTQILLDEPPSTFGSVNYSVPLISTLPNALKIKGAVGYLNASGANSNLKTYTIDTGSLGTIVTASDLPSSDGVNTLVIGPGSPGAKCYNSSNNAFFGNYYLAPVDIQVTDGGSTTSIKTNPLIVLAVNQFCKVENCKTLTKIASTCTSSVDFHYMGVGFDRGSTAPGDLFSSPTANAFLHVTDANNGTDISPGYILSANGVTLGINSTTGFNTIPLTADTSVPGDWNPQCACYSFPGLSAPNQFCGTGLLDVGITEMFIDLPFAQRPPGSFDSNNKVPANLTGGMNVLMGPDDGTGACGSPAAASYSFQTLQATTPPTSPAPTYSQWIDITSTDKIFVNTGRDPLNCYNYLFAGQLGQVGFQKVSPEPAGCSGAN